MKLLKIILQVAGLYVLLFLGNQIAEWLHLPIPGSIVGLVLLFLLLKLNIVKVQWVESGASLLLSQLLLFFIPSAIGVVEYKTLFGFDGLKIIAVIILSSLVVMACTGLSAEQVTKWKRGKKHDSSYSRS